jgi:sugar/nucleoside kinase (ribokinase family)
VVYAGEKMLQTVSLHLLETEIRDFTGAGDIYAGVFAMEFKRTNNLLISSVSATLVASLKIIGFGGIGIDSIPTLDQVKRFIKNNPARYNGFLRKNNIDELPLFD